MSKSILTTLVFFMLAVALIFIVLYLGIDFVKDSLLKLIEGD